MKYFVGIALLVLCFSYDVVNANASVLPVEAFGRLPDAISVKLSPSGEHFAFINNRKGNTLIGVSHIDEDTIRYVVQTDNQKFKIDWYRWANNKTLLVSVSYPRKNARVKYISTHLFKVSIDGKQEFEKVFVPNSSEWEPQFGDNIIDLLPDDPNNILMGLSLRNSSSPDVYKVNLNSQTKRSLVKSREEDVYDWMTDRQQRVRLGFGRNLTNIFYIIFDTKTEKWKRIWDYEIFDAPDISPLGFALDSNILYVRANHEGRYAIFKVNVSDPSLKLELVHANPNYDIEGGLLYSSKSNDVIGVYDNRAKDGKIFFSDKDKKFQESMNKAIPNAHNNVYSMSRDENKYILYTSHSKAPGAYYLGDKKTKSLQFILERYPLLYDVKLSGKKKVSYKARDGLEIEAYVTLPHANVAATNAALVIPHGGPMSRSYGGFDWFAEFFASRGYTVIEPNFRGSSGYGFEFEMESIQKWGGAMQDDLADAANWLVKNYSVEKKKVCIVGASYGGYAALMAAAKQADTFKCATSLAGVSDLKRVLRNSKGFNNYKVVKKQIGMDSNLLRDSSPINFASTTDIPVLLLHGTDDRIVDVGHSEEMYNALKKEDKRVRYVELPKGNHYLEIESNRIKTLAEIESFLAEYLLN